MADDLRVFARDLFQQAVFVQPQLSLNTSASAGGALSLLGRDDHLLKHVLLDPRTYLPLISGLSLLAFIGQFLVAPHVATWFRQRRHAYKPVSSRSSDTSATLVGDETKPSLVGTEIKGLGYVQRSGGAGVVAWAVLKLIALVALEVLTIIAAVGAKGRRETVESWCLVSSVGYCAVLSLLSLTVRPSVVSAKTRALKAHLVTILAATWVIYFVRDIYPLATFTVPTQDPLTALLWVRLGLLTFAAVVAPLFSPRTHVPVSQPLGAYEPTAEQTASIVRLLTFAFLDSLIKKAWGLPSVPYEDFPPLADVDHAAFLRQRVMHHLDPGSTDPRAPPRGRHIGWRICRVFWREIIISLLLSAAYAVMQFADVLGVNRLLRYIETGGEGAVARPWVWVFLVGFGPFAQSSLWNVLIYLGTRLMVRAEASLALLLFNHSLRIQPRDKAQKEGEVDDSKNLVGRINSLMSSDLTQIINLRVAIIYGITAPMGTVLSAVFLYRLLGRAAFVAMALTIIQLPIPAKLTMLTLSVQKAFAGSTDARVQKIQEAISSLRITKLFGLETQVKKQIQDLRKAELALNLKRKMLRLTLNIINTILPLLVMIATFAWFTIVEKGELTAAVVFSAISVFGGFAGSLQMFIMLTSYVESWVSLGRVNAFLQETELIDRYEAGSPTAVSDDPSYIGFRNATFAWLKDVPAGSEERNFKLHFDGDLRFPVGKISLVAGQTGCGKTSLLMALLGEMHFEQRGPDSSFGLPRTGGVAYASQQSWLQNLSLRDNILFGAPFDEERYKLVVKECALERDFTLFDAGDATEVGEKGLTLSGGQKARVTLARAIYSRADVLLLDDILSALDVHTSKFIVDNLLKGSLVKNRTVILVTHHVGLASQVADYLVTLEDGRVKSHGSISELKRVDSSLFKEAEDEEPEEAVAAEIEAVEGPVDAAPAETKSDGKLVLAEEKAQGHISKRALSLLAKSLGGPVFWLIVIGLMIVNQAASLAQVAVLGAWAREYDVKPREDVVVAYWLGLYGGIVFLATGTFAVGFWVWTIGSVRSGVSIHEQLLDSVFAATMRWLDSTPQGRIIARFVSDTRTLDGELTEFTRSVLDTTITLLIKLATIAFVVPVFGLAGLVLGCIGAFVAELYIHAQMSCKRESSNKKSPLFSHFGDAIAGLISVRAYDSEEAMKTEAEKRCDAYVRTGVSFYNLNRWCNVRLDAGASAYSTMLAAYLIYGPTVRDASTIGFILSVSISFSSSLLMYVRILNMWEVSGNSLERIQDYLVVESEEKPKPSGVPPAYWPASGSIRAEGLIARYSVGGPVVLKGIDVEIKSGERVGVVGRTGSGKSTLALALLRLIPTEGKVFIDGIATDKINLDALRSKITIIPQDPTLFSGSLRRNLDPYDEHEDEALLEVLKSSGLSGEAASGDGTSTPHHLTLTSEISAGGENLSQGQRQLVSLARGLVRRSKIFLLDEATASVDFATDVLIQQSIRSDLQGVTLITIAHRLRTIMDYDKILCLDAGKVIEFDTPAKLIKAGGQFADMVANSPDADELRELAAGQH